MFALTAPPIAAIVGAEVRERQRYPRRFAEVVPNEVYRGGFPSAEDIVRLKEEKSIRSIVNLTGPTDRPEEKEMLAAVERLGIRLTRLPMPGDGRGDYEALEQAAIAIADRANRPVFFHCAAGKQRSNAAWAAYRMKFWGWSVDQALDELERDYDLDRDAEWGLCEHLRGYQRWRFEYRPAPTSQPMMEGP